MLERLYQQQNKWIGIAYKFCGCEDLAKDIVQDMYIKVFELGKEVNSGYVYSILRSIFIENTRKANRNPVLSLGQEYHEGVYDEAEELADMEVEYEILDNFVSARDSFKELNTTEKIIVQAVYTDGLRSFSRETGISINTVQKTVRKYKEKCQSKTQQKSQEDRQRKLQDSETLSPALQMLLESCPVQVAKNAAIF